MRQVILVSFILTVALMPPVDAAIQWKVENGGNGHFYGLVGDYTKSDQRWTWSESKTMAEGMSHLGIQGHLVTISSAAENQFIIENLHVGANRLPAWLGLTDSEAFGGFESFGQANPRTDGWVWVTGEAIVFTGWNPGNPDNTNDEDFAIMGSVWGDHSDWNDVQSGSGGHAPFFIEFDVNPKVVPEPTTLAIWSLLGGIGLVVEYRRRRRKTA
ncbi:MAG: hypothetical protein H8E66_23370 [Planctomycetes bacterium]|nr:hypothetical protein [Planctomycetota bacterium]